MEKVFSVILVLLDVAAVWLLLRPSTLSDLWTAGRVPSSEWDRFIARLVAAIILWIQLVRWVGRAQNENPAIVLNALSILIWAYAAAFLVYKFAVFRKSKRGVPRKDEEAHWRPVPSESDLETRARYHAAWRRYARLRVLFPLLLLGWLPFGYVLGAIFRFFDWNITICMIIVLALVPLMPVVGWKWSYWPCPRCGKAFKGKYHFFPKRCYYCNLPKWAESPDDGW